MTIPSKDFLSFIADQESLDKVAQHIRTQVYGYITKYRLQSLVLGISGGIDSALCAALLKPVCEQAFLVRRLSTPA